MSKVVITGLGLTCSAGSDLDTFRANVLAGMPCFCPLDDPRLNDTRARFVARAEAPPVEDLRDDPAVRFALRAARECLAHAGVDPDKRRIGLMLGTCSGPMNAIEAHYEKLAAGDESLTADERFRLRYYSVAKRLAEALGLRGLSATVATACSSATAAIAVAADLIRLGVFDAILAGGADAYASTTLAGFDQLKATSLETCAPFSTPPGMSVGEGAAFVLLESAASARERRAPVFAAVLGAGTSNDAYHSSSPHPRGTGLSEAMTRALAQAGLSSESIGYVNAHGTGTEANDKAETRALAQIFSPLPPVSSTKAVTGHCLGAAGGVELIASILAAHQGVLPPTANYKEPRDGCALDAIPEPGRPWNAPRVFLSNNAAFGGHNASLAVRVEEQERDDLKEGKHEGQRGGRDRGDGLGSGHGPGHRG